MTRVEMRMAIAKDSESPYNRLLAHHPIGLLYVQYISPLPPRMDVNVSSVCHETKACQRCTDSIHYTTNGGLRETTGFHFDVIVL